MSIRAMVWAFEQELPCATKFVLVALADAADQDGKCWPSQAAIAKKCGLSRQHVNNIIGDLEVKGFVSHSNRRRDDGAVSSCEYSLNIPNAEKTFPDDKEIPGVVYLVASAGAIKIGITRDLKRRVDGMKGQSGESISIVKSWPMPMRLAREVERAAHDRFADERRHGEWFDITTEAAINYLSAAVSAVTTPMSTEATPLSTEATPPVSEADTPCQRGRHHEPKLEPEVIPPLNPPHRGESIKSDFDAWWQEYPRKVGKDAAERKYQRARKTVSAAVLLAGVRRYAAAVANTEREFIAHPATWLNAGRWQDDYGAAPAVATEGPTGPPPRPEDLWPELRADRTG